MFHISFESGVLEDPAVTAPDSCYKYTVPLDKCKETPDDIQIIYEKGDPVKVIHLSTGEEANTPANILKVWIFFNACPSLLISVFETYKHKHSRTTGKSITSACVLKVRIFLNACTSSSTFEFETCQHMLLGPKGKSFTSADILNVCVLLIASPFSESFPSFVPSSANGISCTDSAEKQIKSYMLLC